MPENPKSIDSVRTAIDGLRRNPVRLRVVLALAVAGGWYMGLFQPLVGQLEAARRRLEVERQRLALADQIEQLRDEVGRFHERLPTRGDSARPPDPNETVQFLLDGVRARPVRLISLDPGPIREFGPYKAVPVKLQAEGSYADLDRLLRWIETNPRMLRVEKILLGPSEDRGRAGGAGAVPRYSMNLDLVGVIG